MTLWFVILGLIFYGARYAFSGIDNGLFYACRRGLTPSRDTSLPDIHVGEVLQSWCGHLSVLSFGMAIVYQQGWSWWAFVGLLLAMNGISQAFTPLFQYYIQQGAGGKEQSYWVLPLRVRIRHWVLIDKEFRVPKVWANRRNIQVYFGSVLFVVGIMVFRYA